MRYDTTCSFTILVFFNKHSPALYSIGKVDHHTHYRAIQQEYIQFILYCCLINFGKKSCFVGKVTYATALMWSYIPYMIHKLSPHR